MYKKVFVGNLIQANLIWNADYHTLDLVIEVYYLKLVLASFNVRVNMWKKTDMVTFVFALSKKVCVTLHIQNLRQLLFDEMHYNMGFPAT